MRVFLISIIVFSFSSLFAQSGWDWGTDKITAQRKYQYIQTYMQSKRYNECRSTVNWLLVNTPNLHKELYNRAAVVYKECEKVEKSGSRKVELQDSLLWIYDAWMIKFGSNQANPLILNQKGKVFYKYYSKRDTIDLALLQDFYFKVLEANGSNTYLRNVKYFMAILLKRKKAEEVTDEEIFQSYNFAVGILEKKKEVKKGNQSEIDQINKAEAQILNSLVKTVSLECASVESYFKPLYEASPEDYELVNSIRLLLNKNKCDDSPFYLEIVKHVSAHEPTAARFAYIGNIELKNNNIDSAVYYFNKALEIEIDRENQSDLYFQLARIANKKGNKTEARLYARKVISTGFQQNKAYRYIGDLYFNSASICDSKDELTKRSIYIAAYLQYEKADNNAKMTSAKAQFPSMEDLFVKSKKEGQIINTGCWINEDVPLKKR